MADREIDTLDPETDPETPEEKSTGKDPRDKRIAELERQLGEAKTWAHNEAAKRLSSQYGVEITPEKLKGQNVQLIEEILDSALKPKGETTPEGETTEPEPTTPKTPAQDVKAAKDFVAKGSPSGAPVSTEVVSAADALKKVASGEWTDAQYRANAERRMNAP